MENKEIFKKAVEEIRSLNSLVTVMQSYKINFKKDTTGYYTNCVFHNDKTPSLRLSDKSNKAIYHCFGCGEQGDIINFICKMDNVDNTQALTKAYNILGLESKYKIKTISDNKVENFKKFIKTSKSTITKNNEIYILEDIYIYSDEDNKPLYCKIKYKNQQGKKYFITKSLIEIDIGFKYGESKDFEECKKVLYNLGQVKKAILKDNWIFFVEGEKDVETLKKLNISATTIYTKKWQESYSENLKNAKIAFIGDSGRAGKEFKNFVVDKLKKCCKGLKIIDLPEIEKIGDGKNKDVTDWLESGKTVEELLKVLKKSLNILDKTLLQQDEKGIYQIISKIENGDVKETRYNLTNFQIIDASIFRNEDNNEQIIKLNIVSNNGRKSIIEADARECFSDVRIFRRYLGIDYIFYGKIDDLIRLQQWVINYFIKKDISIFTRTGIREINNETVLVTNHGILRSNGDFYTNQKAINYIHNIDFTNIDILSKEEAEYLSYHLFNFNSKENVYNTLGLGVANMLNSFARRSNIDNIPILKDLGESKSGKSKVLTILRLLFNNTSPAMSLSTSTDFELLKSFDETYLPVFLDDVKVSKVSNCKINSLSNHIYAITEGYEYAKDTKNLTLNKYSYNASLIISGEEEMQETAVKNRSNIVWYAISNFTEKGKESVEFLCNTKKGEHLLRRFSKSLYLQVLEFTDESFEIEYLITRNKYDFEKKLSLSNSREVNTATYTMMGLILLYNTFESLGVNMEKIIDLNEASNIIVKNIKLNVLDEHEGGAKTEYEKILEEINNLVCIEDKTIRVEENFHYRILSNNCHIAFDFKTIYDKLNKYYKLYKNDNDKLLDYKTFIKMISKSSYIVDSDPKKHYIPVKRKVLAEGEDGAVKYDFKNKKMFILKIDEVRKLEMDNIFYEDDSDEQNQFEEVLDKVIPFN